MLIDSNKVKYNGSINFEIFNTIATKEELECIYDGQPTLISVTPKDNAICVTRNEFVQLMLDIFHDWIVEFCQNTRKGRPTVKNINYNKFKIFCIVILATACLLLSFKATAIPCITLVVAYNSFCLLCKCWIVLSSWFRDAIGQEIRQFETEEYRNFKNKCDLPVYTILVPMFHENEKTISQMLNTLRNINYPRDKLDVKLVLEEDDIQTREVLENITLEEWVTPMWMPYFEPRTKPKACNIATLFAKGEYLVIFDAEDKPEPEQLLKAVYTFRQHQEIDILQGCLSFYNHNQNLLTTWFNVEYTTWFKLSLPEFSRMGITLPLGGTSNHIRTKFLFQHFWDSYHVTEDLELSTVAIRYNKQIMHLASDTTEWCVVNLKSWIKQRTRWMKGYLLTYYLNACSKKFNSNIKNAFFLHVVVGYSTFAYLVAPLVFFSYNLLYSKLCPIIFLLLAQFVLYHLSLVLSYYYTINITNKLVINRNTICQTWKLFFTLILYPLYFSLHFITTWLAVVDIWKRPFYWAKTEHLVGGCKIKNKGACALHYPRPRPRGLYFAPRSHVAAPAPPRSSHKRAPRRATISPLQIILFRLINPSFIVYLLFRITLLLTISTMCSVLASTYARAEIVRNITIDGNARTGDNVILSSMPFKVGDNILEKDINDATKQLYASGYFSDVSVDMDYGNVVVKVLESPIVSGIYFTGNGKLGDKEIKKELLSKEMQTYSKNKVKFDLDRMYSVYQKMGYLGAQIEPKVVFLENNTVDLIFDIKEGDLSHIDEIIFSGNDNYSARTLKDTIFSRERSMFALTDKSGQFQEDTIAEDTRALTEFYQNRGYAKMNVEKAFATLNKDDYNFTLNFFINEGKVYKFGNSRIRTEHTPFQNNNTLRKAIKSKKGSEFSLEKLQETTTEMAEYLNSNGFANVVPTYELHYDDEAQTVDVEYVLNATEKFYIDRIKISGNVTTKDQVILRELMIHEGDIYNAKLIEESRDRLYMLGFFKKVEMKENFIPNSDLIELEIKVEEQLFASLNFSAGWSNYFGIIGSVNAQINNLLGRGYSAGIGLERSGWSESVNVNFYDPYFFKNYNIGMGISGFASKFGDLGGGTKYTSMMLYKGYSYGGNLTFGFELATRLMLQFSLGMAHYTYKMMAATGFRLYDQLLGTRNSNTVGLTLTWNRMNRARYATKGFMMQYSLTFAGLGFMGGQQFMQNSAQIVVNHQLLGEDLILHTELMGGIVTKLNKSKQIGFENLYSLGGYQMRGFNFFGIGPRIARYGSNGTYNTLYYAIEALQYYYATLELRSPLFLPKDMGVYLSAFVDIGSAWGFAGKLNKKSYTIDGVQYKESVLDSAMMRMSAGVAINWQSPMGEIGLYYARPIIKKAYDTPLEFGIKFGAQY